MKTSHITICLLSYYLIPNIYSQKNNIKEPTKYTAQNKGKIYFFWGGNRESFTTSDIHFKGNEYDFTIHDVVAHDKGKGWHLDYFNPFRMTIPQTNFRLGYFISNNYNVSIGVDHMKYVMIQYRAVNLTGNYPNAGSYGELLPDNQVLLTEDFLTFEHTDGLNYINSEISRVDDISDWINLPNTDVFQINLTEGFGAGVLLPKTNSKLLGNERNDEFHVAGFGISAKIGLNLTFFKHFFIQSELKSGYINMNDIRTTKDTSDRASQDFFFFQRIISIGGIFII